MTTFYRDGFKVELKTTGFTASKSVEAHGIYYTIPSRMVVSRAGVVLHTEKMPVSSLMNDLYDKKITRYEEHEIFMKLLDHAIEQAKLKVTLVVSHVEDGPSLREAEDAEEAELKKQEA